MSLKPNATAFGISKNTEIGFSYNHISNATSDKNPKLTVICLILKNIKIYIMRVKDCYNFDDFRKLAKSKLPAPIFHYIDGGADDEATLKHQCI